MPRTKQVPAFSGLSQFCTPRMPMMRPNTPWAREMMAATIKTTPKTAPMGAPVAASRPPPARVIKVPIRPRADRTM